LCRALFDGGFLSDFAESEYENGATEQVKIFLLLLGGAIGSLARYLVTIFSVKTYGTGFPVGTLFVNLVGCFLIGLVFGLGEYKGISPTFRIFFITGFLGALTTFSTYSLETVNNAGSGSFDLALMNIAANNIGGLILVKVGLAVSRFV
jgi:CrcB protein